MKAFIILSFLTLYASITYAETYKWEDANGVHYTDNAASVPQKYRAKVLEESKVETKGGMPPVGVGISQPSSPAIQIDQNAIYQANIEQQRRVTEAMRQQQAKVLAQSTKKAEGAMQSLAKFMAIWLLVGAGIFVAWVLTILDIVRSEFTTPSNKTVWVILVVLLPLLGMLLYFLVGIGQKRNYMSAKDREQAELIARLKPRNANGKDFTI